MNTKLSFENTRKKLIDDGVFKKTQKKIIPELKAVFKVLYNEPKSKLRSQEISNIVKLQKKYVDSRLHRLVRVNLIRIIGRNRKYLRDVLNDKPIFPGKISEKVDSFITMMIKDAITRTQIKDIIINTLNVIKDGSNDKRINKIMNMIKKIHAGNDFDLILDELKSAVGEENMLSFYQGIFQDILESGLYDENKGYGKLFRQCIAYKYGIKDI